MLTTISSYMDEIEVINVWIGYIYKKTDIVIKSPSFLAHSWSGRNYMCKGIKQNTKHLEMIKSIIITFSLQWHLPFLEDLVFGFISFFMVYICTLISLLGIH